MKIYLTQKLNRKIILMLSFLLLASGCLEAPGSGTEAPNFINSNGNNTGGGGSSSTTGLPDYKNSGTTLVTYRGNFIESTAHDLKFETGPSGAGFVRASVAVSDFPTYVIGCVLTMRFVRSDNSSVVRKTGTISSESLVGNNYRIVTSEFPLGDIIFQSGTPVPGANIIAYAYVECPSGKTSNILYGAFLAQ